MDKLRALMIESPERLTNELTDGAIEGSIKWYEDKLARGESIHKGLLAKRLIEGGMEGFGTQAPAETKSRPWFHDSYKRAEWVDANVPDLQPDEAEAALITLAGEGRTISAESVTERVHMGNQADRDFLGKLGHHFGAGEVEMFF